MIKYKTEVNNVFYDIGMKAIWPKRAVTTTVDFNPNDPRSEAINPDTIYKQLPIGHL